MKFFFCAFEAIDGEIKSGFCSAEDEADARGKLVNEIGSKLEIVEVRYLGDWKTGEECQSWLLKKMSEDVDLIEGDDG